MEEVKNELASERWMPPDLNRTPHPPFLVHGNIAWEIPKGTIAERFVNGTYKLPGGWTLRTTRLDNYVIGMPCGEIRFLDKEKPVKKKHTKKPD